MGNVIQIKRGSGQPGAGVLADGELGYDTSGGFLYIGVNGASVKIKAEGSGGSSGTISGILSLAQGGTGADLSTTDTTTNSIIIKGSSTALSSIAPKAGAFYCTGVNEVPKYGTLPASIGGTGMNFKGTTPFSIIIKGQEDNQMSLIEPVIGAFYCTGNGVLPKYGTLPASIGGTGANLKKAAAYSVIIRDPTAESNSLSYIEPPTNKSGVLVYDYSSNPKATKFISSLPLTLGGTGANLSGANAAVNSIIIKGDSALSSIAPSSGAFYYNGSSLNFGTLPLAHGGTGSTTGLGNARSNAVIIKHNTDQALSWVGSVNGAFYSTGRDVAPTFGILPTAQGGTGADLSSVNVNSIIIKGSSGLEAKTPKDGAVYYTSTGTLNFGTLPISKGGTGATTAAQALSNLGLVTPSVSEKINSTTSMTLTSTNRFIVLTVVSSTRTAPIIILEASSITTTEKTATVSFDSEPLNYQLGIKRQSADSNNYIIRAITRECTVNAYGIL